MNRNVRISRVDLAKLKRENHNLRVMLRTGLLEQTTVHHREVTAFSSELVATREALRTCLELVEASQRGWWTPANDKQLEEIKKKFPLTAAGKGRVKI